MQMTFLLLYIVLAPWMWFETGTQANSIISIQNLRNWNCPDIIWWFIFFILSFFMYSWGWGGGPVGPPFHIWPLQPFENFPISKENCETFLSGMVLGRSIRLEIRRGWEAEMISTRNIQLWEAWLSFFLWKVQISVSRSNCLHVGPTLGGRKSQSRH